MAVSASVAPRQEQQAVEQTAPLSQSQTPWSVVVWDDPVNLMTYVTHVFTTYFHYPTPVAEKLMLRVHHEGRAVVASGERELMERHVAAMHGYGLLASLEES